MKKYPAIVIIVFICMFAFACSKSDGRYIDTALTDKIVPNVTTREEVVTLLGPCDDQGRKDGIEVMSWYYVVSDVYLVTSGFQPRLMQTVEVYFNENGTVKQVVRQDNAGN